MRLDWLTRMPTTTGIPQRGDGSSTLLHEVFPKSVYPASPLTAPKTSPAPQAEAPSLTGFLDKMFSKIRDAFSAPVNHSLPGNLFMTPEQKTRQQQIETYAESPFEQTLFSLRKKPGDFVVSKAWAQALQSSDTLKKDAALTLLRSFFAYSGVDNQYQLSAHTQMKLMIFSPHLSEGALGKAILFEAILKLPIAQILEFAGALKKEFGAMPPLAQGFILKQILQSKKLMEEDPHLNEEDEKAFRKLVKELVIQFYSGKQEAIAQDMQMQEKIRTGFLKMQPIDDAYQKALEEVERRYRQKLRQLKKNRSQKVAEAEEEKLRRIELIYDSVEGDLDSGLGDLNLELEKVLAS